MDCDQESIQLTGGRLYGLSCFMTWTGAKICFWFSSRQLDP